MRFFSITVSIFRQADTYKRNLNRHKVAMTHRESVFGTMRHLWPWRTACNPLEEVWILSGSLIHAQTHQKTQKLSANRTGWNYLQLPTFTSCAPSAGRCLSLVCYEWRRVLPWQLPWFLALILLWLRPIKGFGLVSSGNINWLLLFSRASVFFF